MKYFDCSSDGLSTNGDGSSANGDSSSPEPTPQIPSVLRLPGDPRIPVKHVLLGAPLGVRHTRIRLHQLGYADISDWAEPLKLRNEVCFQPQPGDVMTMLVRYLLID